MAQTVRAKECWTLSYTLTIQEERSTTSVDDQSFALLEATTWIAISDTKNPVIGFSKALNALGVANEVFAERGLGNLKAGNSEKTLLSAMVHIYRYLGFPRVSNAIQAIKEATAGQEKQP